MTDRDEQMLTIADVAHLLQVATKTVRRMVADGEFPRPIRVAKSDRWTLGTIRRWQWREEIRLSGGNATPADRGQSGTNGPLDGNPDASEKKRK